MIITNSMEELTVCLGETENLLTQVLVIRYYKNPYNN